MEDGAQKSCWGVTIWAVAGFAGVVALMLLLGGGETGAMIANR